MKSENIFQELYELLCVTNYNRLCKIPKRILTHIYNNRNTKYKTRIDISNPFDKNTLSKEAFQLYFNLDYNYMMTQEERDFVNSDS